MWSRRACRANAPPGVVDFCRRELGDLNPRAFATLANASEDFVLRFRIHGKLDKHHGCVNTVSFNADGNILISGSDDRMIMLWDWNIGTQKLVFHSGHRNNVFQAKFMPSANDRSIVTSAADGEVRHAQIRNDGQIDIKLLVKHDDRVHKIAIEPGNPHVFYSCGEDGRVLRLDLRKPRAMPLFTCNTLEEFHVRLNAIALDPRDPNFFAIAGSDELVRLYDVRRFTERRGVSSRSCPIDCFCPPHLLGNTEMGITGLAFSDQREVLASYGSDKIYLFSKDQGLGPQPHLSSSRLNKDSYASVKEKIDMESDGMEFWNLDGPAFEPQEYFGHRNCETMKGVGFYGPNCEYVVSGSDCGRIFIWRKKDGKLLRAMKGDRYVVNCIESHPHLPVLASSGIEEDVKMWLPNSEEREPPIDMNEVLNYCPSDSFSFFLRGFIEQSEDDEDDDIEVDDDHSDISNGSSESFIISDDDCDSDDSDLASNCKDSCISDKYLACGGGDVL